MNKKMVYILDDNRDILNSLKLLLTMENYDVKIYDKSPDLLQDLQTLPLPNALLIDIWLNGEDGRDICKRIKHQKEFEQIPILIMSANTDLLDSALASGANDFLSKPFDLDNLLDKIHKYVNGDK